MSTCGQGVSTACALAIVGAMTLVSAPALAQVDSAKPADQQAPQPPPAVEATPAPGTSDEASIFEIDRVTVHLQPPANAKLKRPLPTDEELSSVRVKLSFVDGVLKEAKAGQPSVDLAILELGRAPYTRIDPSGILAITGALVDRMTREGYLGVAAAPAADQMASNFGSPPSFTDKREGTKSLTILVLMGYVKEIRTVVASASDDPERQRINPDKDSTTPARSRLFFERVRNNSPLQEGSLIDKNELSDYIASFSRNPTRRVEASIAAAGDEPGSATLDYLVAESKPWLAYFQLSNTGTKQTREWRERFGFEHTSLTGRDDVLRLDYSTAGFSESHDFLGSYEVPVDSAQKIRVQVFGEYDEYTASDVGSAALRFTGNGWNAGAQVAYELFRRDHLWVDAFAGFRYDYSETKSFSGSSNLDNGKGEFAIPYVGVRAGHIGDASSFDGSVVLDIARGLEDFQNIDPLGRLGANKNYEVLKFDLGGAFYLEPLLHQNEWNARSNGPGCTLAHELYAHLRGQWAAGYRLVPTAEQVLGGFSTVRGYPESAVAGDTVVVGSFEYRFHLPHALSVNENPSSFLNKREFRGSPSEPWGTTDWDLILRAFFDAGWSHANDKTAGETDATLVSAGIGAEVQFASNFNARLDWGFPLRSLRHPPIDVSVGESRVHFILTLSY